MKTKFFLISLCCIVFTILITTFLLYHNSNKTVNVLEADDFIQKENIEQFINKYKGTTQALGFKADKDGNFYVVIGDVVHPNGYSSGIAGEYIIIYSVSKPLTDDGPTLYKYAAHLANIMNYILFEVKGPSYGSGTPLLPDEYKEELMGSYYTSLKDQVVTKCFYLAMSAPNKNIFGCSSIGHSSESSLDGVSLYYDNHIVIFE